MTNADVIHAWCDRLHWHCHVPHEFRPLLYSPGESGLRRSLADLTEAVRVTLLHTDLSITSSVLDLWGWRAPMANLREALQVVI